MGLESGTRIQDLVLTNPGGGDALATADDHLRLIKAVLDGQFPNLGLDAVTASASEINQLNGLTISAFARTLLDDVDAAVMQSTLGITDYVKTLLDDADAATARGTLGLGSAAVQTAGNASGNVPISNGTLCTNLNAERWGGGRVSIGTGPPSGGSDGDVHFQYTA